MFSAENTSLMRFFVGELLHKMNFDYDTIRKLDSVIPLQYYPFILSLVGLIILLICIGIVLKRNTKKKEAQREEEEFRKSEEEKIKEEDKRLSRYHSILQMIAEELCVSEAQIEFELEKIFKNSPQLKEAEVYHRVSINRSNKERDIILSNWYMSNDKVDVIKNLVKGEERKSEVNYLKDVQYIKENNADMQGTGGTWECKKCGNINYESEKKCLKCGSLIES